MLPSFQSVAVSVIAVLASQAVAAAIPAAHELSPRNQCSGQNPGSCNFVLWAQTQGKGVSWTGATIYDYACNSLGSEDYPRQGDAMYSPLPWTVVIEHLATSGQFQSIGMCYGSYCYQGVFACSQTGTTISCAHSFPC